MATQWKVRQETMCREALARAREVLSSAGILRERVRCESRPLNADVAGDIIDEAQDGKYGTIVVGRRGTAMAASLLMGSVASKVVDYARDWAVSVAA